VGTTTGTAASNAVQVPATVAAAAPRPLADGAFDATDDALRRRVSAAGIGGGVVYVVRDGEVVHDLAVGSVGRQTPLSVASAAKWLTAATLMTYVDEGRLALDDPISRWLPEFEAWDPPVTVRQLLQHTSGVRDQGCIWSTGGDMADCVERLASGPKEFPPGRAFSYGNAGYHVIGRLLEVLGGDDFATVVDARLTGPLGMAATTWPGAPNNPSPAAGVRTTVDDYARYLAVLLADGVAADGRRLLSSAAVGELARNQVGDYDTSRDFAVGITDIPRYALGAWPDLVDDQGATIVVSGNGAAGFYPWVDFEHRTYGVVGVQDGRGAEVAVPASQAVFREARAAYAGS
jgi:CubicO group peptidase (beta-lactamase class C family)